MGRGLFFRRTKLLVRQRFLSSSFSTWMREGEDRLSYLPDVKIANELVQAGRHDEGIVLLQRVTEVCKSAMGKTNSATLAALRHLGYAFYTANRLGDAEKTLQVVTSGLLYPDASTLSFLCRSQLFQGVEGVRRAVNSAQQAILTAEDEGGKNADTVFLGEASLWLGTSLMIEASASDVVGGGWAAKSVEKTESDVETSLLRSTRLADGPSEEAIALSLLATHSLVVAAAEGKQREFYKEALEYYADALQIEGVEPELRGRILCNSAEVQLLFDGAEATSTAAELLSESIKLLSTQSSNCSSADDDGDLANGTTSPSLVALGWSEALAGHCYRLAGQPVISEGLFRSAAERLNPLDEVGAKSTKSLRMHGDLLLRWDRRESAGKALHDQAITSVSLFHLDYPEKL